MTIRQFLMPLALGAFGLGLAWGQQYTISTYAGNGTAGFSGDSGAPTSAQLSSPLGLAIDSSGNLYIVDSVNQRVRKISGGNIMTVAGNGTAGFSGDGKAATSAEMLDPAGVALDSSGNIYIADTENHVIREVTVSNGNISTIAGNNTGGYGGDGGAATSAELEFPTGVALDASGKLYIADSGNHLIRQVSGGTINTFAGNAPNFRLHDPESIVFDSSGNLFISEPNGYKITKFFNGVLTLVAGNGLIGFSGDNGPAVDASFDEPMGIALDANGYLYVCDTDNNRIRKIAPDGTVTTIAGVGVPGYGGDGGPATSALLSFPRGIAVDAAFNVYVADTGNNVIRKLQPGTPAIATGGVVNAASFTAALSPGALASIFGSNFAGAGGSAASLPLPPRVGGASVLVNGVAAPVLYASSSQINFQIPWEMQPGTATVMVNSGGMVSNQVNVTIQAAAPGLFVNGSHAIVQNSDFSLNSSSNPAKAGNTIIAYLTGAGAASPQPADGAAAGSEPLSTVSPAPTASIGGTSAMVTFAGLAPGFVGLWQLNIVVPSVTNAGDLPLVVSAGGQSSNAGNVSVTP